MLLQHFTKLIPRTSRVSRAEPFRSQIRQVIRGRTEELERLAVEM